MDAKFLVLGVLKPFWFVSCFPTNLVGYRMVNFRVYLCYGALCMLFVNNLQRLPVQNKPVNVLNYINTNSSFTSIFRDL